MKKITEAQLYYLTKFYKEKRIEELIEATGLSKLRVNKEVNRLKLAEAQSVKVTDHFIKDKGSVIMTPAQAMLENEITKKQNESNTNLYSKMEGVVFLNE